MDVSVEQAALREFAAERSWDQFHTPKNLAMALSGEVGELAAVFQWLTPEESLTVMSSDAAVQVRDEMADVCIYLLRLADVLGVDLTSAVASKLAKNRRRYTVEGSWGSSQKR
jgi:dCTP diphosphatase